MGLGRVILVPGIAGSCLGDPPNVAGLNVVWLNPVRLIAGELRRVRLPVPGEEDDAPTETPLTEGYPLPAYYWLCSEALSQRGWSVHSPSADWRLPLPYDASRLLNMVRDFGSQEPVNVVCHSRGGMLMRLVLAQLQADNQLSFVRRVIGMGVPHTGSLNAAAMIACWHPFKLSLMRLGDSLPLGIGHVIGFDLVRAVVRSWPSMYELLPAPAATWLKSVNPRDLYNPATYADSPLNPVPAYLAAALMQWQNLPDVPPEVDWIDVAGYGSQTAIDVPDLARVCVPGNFAYTMDGDGTVPVASACQAPRKRILTPTAHDLIPSDGRLWRVLHDVLLNGLKADVTLEGFVLSM